MRVKLIIVILCLFSVTAFALLPKVAVLDAILPENMDKDITIGITEKISEELVGSGKFTVLDRTAVTQSLKEIEFQMSGMVSDAEIKKAGERLGAAYIVVARVSFITGTFFISAKMIDVKTGEIAVQASDEEDGKASISLKIAKRVGTKLAGGTLVVADTTQKKEPEVKSIKTAPIQLQPDLVAWYKFDETSGTVATDSSGNGKDGKLFYGATWTQGKIGNAVDLRGSGKYVKLPDGIIRELKDFTIACWVKVNSAKTYARIFDFGTGESVYLNLLARGSSGVVSFAITIYGPPKDQGTTSLEPLSLRTWKHIAVTLSGKEGILYIDGVEINRNSSISLTPSSLGKTWANFIGKSQYTNDPCLDGLVDDFRIYNKALSPEQLLGIMSADK